MVRRARSSNPPHCFGVNQVYARVMGARQKSASLHSQPRENESDVCKQAVLFRGDETPKQISAVIWSCPYMLPAFDGNFPGHRGPLGRAPRGILRAQEASTGSPKRPSDTRGVFTKRGVRLRYGKVVVMYKIPSVTHTHAAHLHERSGSKWR